MSVEGDRMAPRCTFYIREIQEGAFCYQKVMLAHPDGYFGYPLISPPIVGDLVWLHDRVAKVFGYFLVVQRSWAVADYGATEWPSGEDRPRMGPKLDIVLEPAPGGPFPDEPPPDPGSLTDDGPLPPR